MRLSGRLMHACRITLFSRDHCGPCVRAKSALSNVWDSRPFDFKEINLSKPGTRAWKDLYNLDVPVVSIAHNTNRAPSPARGKHTKTYQLTRPISRFM